MQACYPKKLNSPHWDTLNITYPVRKFPDTGVSSEAIARRWRGQPEILRDLKEPINEIIEYYRDYNLTKDLTRSQTTEDFGYKLPETKRYNKHTSCTENEYIYPPSRRLADRIPQCKAHGTTEMRESLGGRETPAVPTRLVTAKDQFKHPSSLCLDQLPEPSFHKELEPLDTTHEGYEKYLDPYLTTSRLHHRPYTADQLERVSCSKDIVTYYSFANIPWVRTPKSKDSEWRLPLSRPKSMYDREKFKEGFREIRTHNKLNWVPGSFRTESRDNYVPQTSRPESKIHNYEKDTRSFYEHCIANLQTNIQEEHSAIRRKYATENSHIGSGKPLCSVLEQYIEKNKRIERKNIHKG